MNKNKFKPGKKRPPARERSSKGRTIYIRVVIITTF